MVACTVEKVVCVSELAKDVVVADSDGRTVVSDGSIVVCI